ncbi:hypothetical protein [Paenibacillus xylaniclasticus]|uniref:hypothetical protein n=1 Tax=Paenibacillus xylaniclasticus TaxID=588083 RepID=UPI000FDB0684|nr:MULTISPECIES: hypothetical protein [Paenibacillus]GFN31341.1 hypothetical protein PCURB6_16010 [Paenibacillus curdlanolyticus]
MINLREILRRHQGELTLKNYLEDRYETTSIEEKNRLLGLVSKSIDEEVEKILQAFVAEVTKGSPASKRRRNFKLLSLGLTIVMTPSIAYAVNEEAWIFVTILSVVLLSIQVFITFQGDEEEFR